MKLRNIHLYSKYRALSVGVRASFWFLVCGFLQQGISVIVTPIFTRILSTSQYGLYSVFSSWVDVLSVIVTLKLGSDVYMQGIVRLDHEEDRQVYTSSLLGLATTSTFAWLILYLIFREQFNHLLGLPTGMVLAMFGIMWATVGYNFWSAKQRVQYKYVKLVGITMAVTIIQPLVGIMSVLLASKMKAEARVVSMAIVQLIAYSWMFVALAGPKKIFFHKKNWLYALRYNLPLIPHYLSQTVLNHFDRIMIQAMVGVSAAGIYSLAYNISMILTVLNNAVNNTLNPWIYQSIKEKKIHRIAGVSYAILAGIGVMNLLLIALAPEVVSIFAPGAYREAIWVIPPVTMAVYFRFAYSLFAEFEFYFQKTNWVMYASLVGAALNIVLNFVFIPIFGYIAAAYATLMCYMVYSGMHYLFMTITCKRFSNNEQPYSFKVLMLISGIFVAVGFGLMFFYNHMLVRYGFVLVCFIASYFERNRILMLFKELRGSKA